MQERACDWVEKATVFTVQKWLDVHSPSTGVYVHKTNQKVILFFKHNCPSRFKGQYERAEQWLASHDTG